MARTRIRTVGQVAMQRVGFLKARSALLFAACWCIMARSIGRPPASIDEYAEWWAQSRSQAFREQAIFRKCFPEYTSPVELALAIGFDVAKMSRDDVDQAVIELVGWAAP